MSARPSAEVIDGSVALRVEDGNIEDVQGSSIMRLGVGLKELLGGSIARTETGTASARLVIGDRPVLVQLLDASIDSNEFRSVIDLSVRYQAEKRKPTSALKPSPRSAPARP